MKLWTVVFALSIIAARAQTPNHTDFRHVIAAPADFHHRIVTVVGLAYIDGDRFTLYESVTAAKNTELKHAISIQKPIKRDYDRLNRWWVEVNGTVDANLHGPHFGGFPCEIILKSLKPLYREKEKLWLTDLGEFRNSTTTPVRVRLSSTEGGAVFDLGPGGTNAVDIHRGKVVVSSVSGKQLFKSTFLVPPRTRSADEPDDRTFQYVIHSDRIDLVPYGARK